VAERCGRCAVWCGGSRACSLVQRVEEKASSPLPPLHKSWAEHVPGCDTAQRVGSSGATSMASGLVTVETLTEALRVGWSKFSENAPNPQSPERKKLSSQA